MAQDNISGDLHRLGGESIGQPSHRRLMKHFEPPSSAAGIG